MSEHSPEQPIKETALLEHQMAVSLAGHGLQRAYRGYVEQRDDLHQIERIAPAPPQALDNVQNRKEEVARAARFLQEQTPDSDTLMRYLRQATLLGPATLDLDPTIAACDPMKREHMTPVSLHDASIPSPVEAIVATIENREVAQIFAEASQDLLTGILLSGSSAWGEYYAPRGDRHLRPDRCEGERSDVDLIAIAKDVDAIGATIDAYIRKGLIDPSEQRRFETFAGLYAKDVADIFSVRAHYDNGEQSIHFLTEDTMEDISAVKTIRANDQGAHRVNLVHDFRPNLPANPGKNGLGYTLDDLKGMHNGHYMPTPKAILDGSEAVGYLSDSPVGSVIFKNGESTYLLGLMDFFIAIKPNIILDTHGRIENWVTTLQRNIAGIQQGVTPVQIPRQKRMPKDILHEIQEELTRL